MKAARLTLAHVIRWDTGEAVFALIRDGQIVRELRECRNWREARVAYRTLARIAP